MRPKGMLSNQREMNNWWRIEINVFFVTMERVMRLWLRRWTKIFWLLQRIRQTYISVHIYTMCIYSKTSKVLKVDCISKCIPQTAVQSHPSYHIPSDIQKRECVNGCEWKLMGREREGSVKGENTALNFLLSLVS
jgi:hypothetical protein